MVKKKVDIDLINVLNEHIIKGWSKDIDRKIHLKTSGSKISEAVKGIPKSQEAKNAMKIASIGRKISEKAKKARLEKIATNGISVKHKVALKAVHEANVGKKRSPETLKKLKVIAKERAKNATEEERSKNNRILEKARASIGPITEELRVKRSLAAKGRKHSEESKNKISESNKGRKYSEEHKANLKLAWIKRKLTKLSSKGETK